MRTRGRRPAGRRSSVRGLLLAALIAVVGLAKALTPTLEIGVVWLGVPESAVGIVIAGLVLLPEGLAALRAAQANRLQTSLNLALGSALASIGLTIPAVATLSIVARPATRTRTQRKRADLAGADACRRCDHIGDRAHDRAAGHRPPGDFRGVFVLLDRALTPCGEIKSQVFLLLRAFARARAGAFFFNFL